MMKAKSEGNGMLKAALVLAVITTIAAAALSYTYYITKDRIEENKGINQALKKVMPGADQFNEKEGYWEAYAGGNLIGKAAIAKKQGYSSEIETIFGIDNEGKITGITIISQAETPNLGSKIEEPEFAERFREVPAAEVGDVDGITGATISSEAVKDSIKEKIGEIR